MGEVEAQQSGGWRKLWRLSIPHKIKMLLWRLCRNNVPVRSLLREKEIRVPLSCEMCGGEIENLMHLFFDCAFAKACWQSLGLSYDTREVENASHWFLDKLCNESTENLIKVATIMWGIWWARNKRVWERKVLTPEVAMNWSSRQVVEWRDAQKKKQASTRKSQRKPEQHPMKWKAPVEGSLKINVDASVFEEADYFSVGMVARDCRGLFVRGRTMKFPGRVSVLEAELIGILEALKWIDILPDRVTVVESDSLLGVNAVKNPIQNRMELSDIVEHCRLIVESKGSVSVGFVRKHANRVAHSIARLSCTLNSFVDIESPPYYLLEILLSDV